MSEVYKKNSRKTIFDNPERQVVSLVPTMLVSQRDSKLNKLPVC